MCIMYLLEDYGGLVLLLILTKHLHCKDITLLLKDKMKIITLEKSDLYLRIDTFISLNFSCDLSLARSIKFYRNNACMYEALSHSYSRALLMGFYE